MKPCPFCGSEKVEFHRDYPMKTDHKGNWVLNYNKPYLVVRCRTCGAHGKKYSLFFNAAYDNAEKAWDRRVS